MDQFYSFFSVLLVLSVFMTISSYNPIHSVFWLVIVFIQSSIFIISLSYEFLGFMLIIIYVGAIAILFLFVIMMLDIFQLNKISNFNNIIPIMILLMFQIIFLSKINDNNLEINHVRDWFMSKSSHIDIISKTLYSDFGIIFIIISILLLVAMVGAIVLTLEINEITKKQILINQHQRNNSWI